MPDAPTVPNRDRSPAPSDPPTHTPPRQAPSRSLVESSAFRGQRRVPWCLLITALTVCACAPKPGPTLDEQFQRILDRGIQRHGARGVSAAVVFPDGRMWTGVSGMSHDTVAMAPGMLFAIGSVTKNVVAALTMRLVEEGILSLDDPLSNWLPAYAHVDPSITIRQLLNHTSGLYMFWENQELWDALMQDRSRYWTPEEVLATIKEPDFEPGTGWRYSNTNYLLLAMIVEKATGSSLSREFKDRFWEPLGIESAYLSQQDTLPQRLAHVYGDDSQFGAGDVDVTFEPRTSHESITFGSSGLFMSAEALARWSSALFSGHVVNSASLDSMLQLVRFRPVANMEAYGLGVEQFDREFTSGRVAFGHGGGNIGTTTYMVYLPDVRTSVVVMANAFPNRTADFCTKRIIRALLRDQGVIGPIPYFRFFPKGLLLLSAVIFWFAFGLFWLRKRIRSTR